MITCAGDKHTDRLLLVCLLHAFIAGCCHDNPRSKKGRGRSSSVCSGGHVGFTQHGGI